MLGMNAFGDGQLLEWLCRETRSPFCFPKTEMGPDILFILQFDDGTRLVVAVQVKIRTHLGDLTNPELVGSAKSVTPSRFFLDVSSHRDILTVEHMYSCKNNPPEK